MSFSDDSVTVDFPTISSESVGCVIKWALPRASTAYSHTSLLILHSRHTQSVIYQRLFCSNRKNLHEPWQARSSDMQLLEKSAEGLACSTPESDRHFVLSEMYYLSILLVQPLKRERVSCPYGLLLLFQYSLGYARNLWLLYQTQRTSILCNYFDLLKAMDVASVLLGLLNDPLSPTYNTFDPQLPELSQPNSLPRIHKRTISEAIQMAIEALKQLDMVTEDWVQKYGYPRMYENVKADLHRTLVSLQ